MFRRFRSWLALMAAAALLLLTAVPMAGAQVPDRLSAGEALELLADYDIVRGDPNGDYRLNDRLTRAEAAALFVRAMGMEDAADAMGSASPFTDTWNHWASPVIAMAANLGLMRGDGNGQFRPDDNITYAEVLTVLLRIVEQEPMGRWDPAVIYRTAATLDFAPAGVDPNFPAVRGLIFQSLANAIARVELSDGRTALQAYVDSEPPELILDESQISTTDTRVVISGTAEGASWVEVDGQGATLTRSSGDFTYTADVPLGTTRLVVKAADLAGNSATETVVVDRQAPTARLEVKGPATIQAGQSAKLTINAYDNNGRPITLQGLDYRVDGGVATFNPDNLTLTAGRRAGKGTLTLTAGPARATYSFYVAALSDDAERLEIQEVNRGRALSPDKEYTVKVYVLDDDDDRVDDDYGREVTLDTAGLSGVKVTPETALTDEGVATFTIESSKEGTVTLEASSRGLDDDEMELDIYDFPIIVLKASPTSIMADGASTAVITAELQDEDGDPVKNRTNREIEIELKRSGTDGTVVDDTIIIARDQSTSTDNGLFKAGTKTGTATIAGTLESRHSYFVKSERITLTKESGGGNSSLSFVIDGPEAGTVHVPGESVGLTLRVVNSSGSLVTQGAYAFQVRLDPMAGTDLTLNGTDLRPVAGRTANDGKTVTGRTYQGKANLQLTYNGAGPVDLTVEPVPTGAASRAYDNRGASGVGSATSSLGFGRESATVSYTRTAASLGVEVISPLGDGQLDGVMGPDPEARSVVNVTVLDGQGETISNYPGTATITRTGGTATRIDGTDQASGSQALVAGKASFTIRPAGGQVGTDQYEVKMGSLSKTVTLEVRAPAIPTIGSAWYDATAGLLTLQTTGLPDGGQVHPELLTITKAGVTPVSLAGVPVPTRNGNSITLDVISRTSHLSELYGSVSVVAASGWYTAPNGTAAPTDENTPIKPMAKVTEARLVRTQPTLFLTGGGFDHGELFPGMMSLGTGTSPVALTGAETTVDATGVTLNLSGLRDSILALGDANLTLTLQAGWLKITDGETTYPAPAATMQVSVDETAEEALTEGESQSE